MIEPRASPELFPMAMDVAADRIQFVRLSQADYEAASFLDGRLGAPIAAEAPYEEVAAAMAGAPIACDYIFHIGHVGSTLLARLLGEHPTVFSLREPQVLRTFAQVQAAGAPWDAAELDRRLATFQALFSRTFAPERRSLVKATSIVCGLADRLMAQAERSRAICMAVGLESYLATMLSGGNLDDLRQGAPARLARLFGMRAPPVQQVSPGELIALSWASDMSVLTALHRRYGARVAWVDFDRFLEAPREGIAAALTHLRGSADQGALTAIMRSPHLGRYSKAPEHEYSPALRREVMEQAKREHRPEMARGIACYRQLAVKSSPRSA